jgi:hypothetical protein
MAHSLRGEKEKRSAGLCIYAGKDGEAGMKNIFAYLFSGVSLFCFACFVILLCAGEYAGEFLALSFVLLLLAFLFGK